MSHATGVRLSEWPSSTMGIMLHLRRVIFKNFFNHKFEHPVYMNEWRWETEGLDFANHDHINPTGNEAMESIGEVSCGLNWNAEHAGCPNYHASRVKKEATGFKIQDLFISAIFYNMPPSRG